MWVSIGYNAFRESKPRNKMFEVFEGNSGAIDVLFAQDKLGRFRTSLINYCEDAVKSLKRGEVCD